MRARLLDIAERVALRAALARGPRRFFTIALRAEDTEGEPALARSLDELRSRYRLAEGEDAKAITLNMQRES